MRRRTFLRGLRLLLFTPLARATAVQAAPAAGNVTYRDSIGSDGGLLAAVLRDRRTTTGVSYAGN